MLKQLLWLGVLATCTILGLFYRNLLFGQERLPDAGKDLPEIFYLVNFAYVDDVNIAKLQPGMLQGAVEGLDPNASYIPPGGDPRNRDGDVFKRTGLVLGKKSGFAYVVAVAPHSPADQAGLVHNDYLRAINGTSTYKLSLHEVNEMLADTKDDIQFTREKPATFESDEVQLKPESFKPQELSTIVYDDAVMVVKIPHDYKGLGRDLNRALRPLKKESQPILLDLRHNALGGDDLLMMLAEFFLPQGVMANRFDSRQDEETLVNPKNGRYSETPLYLLVDQSTSRAAESFTAIAQSLGRAMVLGETTSGLPAAFRGLPLSNGGFVVIPAGQLKLKDGALLLQNGVTPDREITFNAAASSQDPLLEEALKTIKGDQAKE